MNPIRGYVVNNHLPVLKKSLVSINIPAKLYNILGLFCFNPTREKMINYSYR